jgi:predicted O-methyltransferase YrrM
MCSLDEDARLSALLARLHREARGDMRHFLRAAPSIAAAWLRGRPTFTALEPHLANAFIPVEPAAGRFLYLTARALRARHVVEFGTSFGISTLYLAAAMRDNGGGRVIGSELAPHKRERALAHLAEGGLAEFAEVRLGDARETLTRDLAGPIDLLFLDGWKELYIPILELLTPQLRPGAVVVADNVRTFRKTLAPFVERVSSAKHGFASVTLPFASGLQYAVRLGTA